MKRKTAELAKIATTIVALLAFFALFARAAGAQNWDFDARTIGLGGVNTLMFALAADTVDYGEWKSGHRTEGASYSVFSFTRKIGQGVGAALAAYAIGLGGYVEGASTQPGSAVRAIKTAAGLVPAAFIVVAVAIIALYPLTEDRFREIIREVAERRARDAPATRLTHVGVVDPAS